VKVIIGERRLTQTRGSGVHPEVQRRLEEAARGRPKASFRVLDWGCGIGTAVAELRSAGWNAMGADIDPDGVERGNAALGGDFLASIDSHGRTAYPDGGFDFVFSQEVFEHVADVDQAVSEIRRLTAAGGLGFHVFPARFRLMEPHVFIPFAHWVPKGRLLHAYVWLCYRFGIHRSSDVNKRALAGLDLSQRAAFTYNYLLTGTYYRGYRKVAGAFREAGFEVRSPILEHRHLARISPLFRLPGLGALAKAIFLNVTSVQLSSRLR